MNRCKNSDRVARCLVAPPCESHPPTDWVSIDRISNDRISNFCRVGGMRTPSQHFSIFSIGSPTSIPPSAHTKEIRKLISLSWNPILMYKKNDSLPFRSVDFDPFNDDMTHSRHYWYTEWRLFRPVHWQNESFSPYIRIGFLLSGGSIWNLPLTKLSCLVLYRHQVTSIRFTVFFDTSVRKLVSNILIRTGDQFRYYVNLVDSFITTFWILRLLKTIQNLFLKN